MSARSRPLTTATGQCAAREATVCRISVDKVASSGRADDRSQRTVVIEKDNWSLLSYVFGKGRQVTEADGRFNTFRIRGSSGVSLTLTSSRSVTTASAPCCSRAAWLSCLATPSTRPNPPLCPASTPELASSTIAARAGPDCQTACRLQIGVWGGFAR